MKQMISKRVRIGMRAAMMLAVVMMMMFATTTEALAQTKYKITTDGNCEVYYYDNFERIVVTEAEAGKELSIWLKEDANPASGYYFTQEYTLNGTSLGSNQWGYNEGFTMPAKDVTIAAKQAKRETISFDLTTTTPQEMPSRAALQFSGDKRMWTLYNDELGGYDVNNSGVADMTYYDVNGEHIYVQRLAGSDASGTFSLTYSEPTYQYSTISFIFPEKKKIQVQSSWITVNGGPFTYTGMEIKPAVTVKDGTKDITQHFDISYNNNVDAGEATVTVTAKTTSTAYTGSASKKFTIKPMPVTITADGETKVYDGQPLTKNSYTHTKLASGDAIKSVTVTGSQTDAGTSENVPSGAVIQNAANENVTDNYAITYTKGTLTVTKASLNITAVGCFNVYDGNAHGITLKNVPEGLTVQYSEDNTNFGSNELKYTNVCDETVYWKVENNNNYDLTSGASGNAQVTITPKAVTISGVKANDKVYDGTTDATIDISGATIDGKVGNDEVNIVAGSAVFSDKNAGEGIAVTFSGFSLTGTNAGNYTLSAQPASVTGTIHRKALELVANAVTIKEGDAVPLTFTGSVKGFVAGENISGGDKLLFTLSDPSACTPGSYGITGTLNGSASGNYGQNYTFSNAAANATAFTIEAKPDPVNPEPEHQPEHVDLTPIGEPEVVKVTGSDDITTVTETTTYTDGSTSVKVTKIYPDGTEIVTLTLKVSNGIVYEETKVTNSDGSKIETESETSTTTVENEDGSTTTTIEETTKKTVTGADGYQTETKTETTSTTVENEDGSETVTTIEKVMDADGNVTETETKTTKLTDAEGNVTEQSIKTVKDADGNVFETIESIKETVVNEDGSETVTTIEKVTDADGNVTEKETETTKVTDASGKTISEYNRETTTDADGSIGVILKTTDAEDYHSDIDLIVSPDGAEQIILTSTDAEGTLTVETVSASHSNEDGSKTCTETVTETTKDAGGNVTEKRTATTESTTKTTENTDGSVTDRETVKTTETDAAGNSRVTGESIRETTTQADGSSVENVSETPDLGDTYSLDEEGGLTTDPEGAENGYTEIASDVSGFIQDNTDVNGGDAYEEDQVSVLLGGAADNVWLNTNEETDAEGEVINQDASLTVKQVDSGDEAGDSESSAQIAINAFPISGSNSGKQSDSDNFGSLSWNYSGSTLTIKGKGTMKQTKPWLKYKEKIKTVRINLGVTNIASNAFSCHTRLTKVHIANSVTNIGSNAFNRCNNLKSVTIASRSKLIKIGKGAFSGLKQRLTINLPSSVTHIGENAFNNCHAHTRVYVKVPHGKVLNVKINGAGSKPQVIKPNSIGKADITSCLFEKLSNRKSSRALTLKMVDAVDDDDTGDDPDDSGDDGDDSGDDGDDSGSGGDDSDSGSDDSGSGGSAIVNGGANKAATTMTINYQTKKATDGGAATADVSGGNSKVTVANNSVVMIGGTVDKIIGGGTRGATAEQEDDEIEIVSGKEYKILRDGYIVLNFYTPDADITVNSIVFRRPGDANNDGFVDAADLVEMINAKNGKASEHFNLTNADIDRDGDITQEDIDAVVNMIMK